ARQICRADYAHYDMLIGMESFHLIGMQRIMGKDTEGKMSLLMDFTNRPGGVSDPWYTRDFDSTWIDVTEGCRGILDYLRRENLC
ncbi:MAG: low molecular weight phosphotyrosine protein phosphatase, partial [Lachnospiraceae bacterium]|nr:low molecular weight phosphotyrosine protein phosphatase [Lachnospiraceae bacterium]